MNKYIFLIEKKLKFCLKKYFKNIKTRICYTILDKREVVDFNLQNDPGFINSTLFVP